MDRQTDEQNYNSQDHASIAARAVKIVTVGVLSIYRYLQITI